MFVLKSNPKKKLQLVKVLDKTTGVFVDSKGCEFTLTLDEVEVAQPMRKCDAKNVK